VKDDRFYFIHMLECISNIDEDTAGRKENFLNNRTVRDSVMHNLRLLAESSKRVSEAERARHPEIPWRDLADFRNVVVHDDLKIDYDEIWLIIQNNLPPLKADLERLVAEPRPRS
jgi:uncharacterized protein with HEPN domain